MDEVGAVRGRPDPAQFYASLRFVDHVVRVADIRIARQLIGKLDRQFMRQTLSRKLLRGSEVQHVAGRLMSKIFLSLSLSLSLSFSLSVSPPPT